MGAYICLPSQAVVGTRLPSRPATGGRPSVPANDMYVFASDLEGSYDREFECFEARINTLENITTITRDAVQRASEVVASRLEDRKHGAEGDRIFLEEFSALKERLRSEMIRHAKARNLSQEDTEKVLRYLDACFPEISDQLASVFERNNPTNKA